MPSILAAICGQEWPSPGSNEAQSAAYGPRIDLLLARPGRFLFKSPGTRERPADQWIYRLVCMRDDKRGEPILLALVAWNPGGTGGLLMRLVTSNTVGPRVPKR